jgi:hypothetical protein
MAPLGFAEIATAPIPIAGAAIIGIAGTAAPPGTCGIVSIGAASERTAIGPYLAMTSPILPYPIKKNRAGRIRIAALAAYT